MRNLAVIDIGSNSVRLLLRADGAEKQMRATRKRCSIPFGRNTA